VKDPALELWWDRSDALARNAWLHGRPVQFHHEWSTWTQHVKLPTHRVTRQVLNVSLGWNSRTRCVGVHRLVLEAFHRPPRPGEVGRHLDGDPANNDADNLAWGTPKQNAEDRALHDWICRQRMLGHSIERIAQHASLRVDFVRRVTGRIRRLGMDVTIGPSGYATTGCVVDTVSP